MKHTIALLLLGIFLSPAHLSGKPGEGINQAQELSPIQMQIKKYCERLDQEKTVKMGKRKVIGNHELTQFYKDLNYKAMWENPKNREDLISIIEDSYYDGLDPEDYSINYIRSFHAQSKNRGKTEADVIAVADIVMTDALLTFALHMIQGRIDPSDLDPNWNYSENKMPDEVEIKVMHRLESQTLMEGVANIRSKLPMYARLQHWFAHYDSIHKAGGEIQIIEYPGSPLRLGDSSAVVGEIKANLSNYSNNFQYDDDDVFDEELLAVLKEFQAYNGLDDDGIAGTETFKMLNISIEDRLDIIRINMERCRWVNNNLPEVFILVNIADYKLYLIRNRKVDYQCRVVVGKEFHETPVFTSNISYLAFNPTWTVPYSIASKEMLPKLKKDPNYLQNRNMTLLRGDKVINPATVDFNKFSQKNFPYTIRQEPGPNNSLGRVKFMFPNKHAVYLHDTPSKSYFEKTERAFSHGCVRVNNPMVLAEQLLGKQGYDLKKINEVLDTKKLTNVKLNKAMPVMLMYWTCYEEDGRIYFYKDHYGRDKVILKELFGKR